MFATGGSGRMYKTTSNAHTLTGDGLGIVFGKGLPLEDMEFHQFHPTGLAGLGILISEAVRGEGGRLLNGDGERFMERYAPTIVDLAPRDIVARSMVLEVLEGRGAGPHKDYVYIDVRHLGADVLEAKLPDIRGALQQSMDNNAAVFRTEETLKQALTDIHALKERYARITVHDKGKRYNSDLLEAIELGFLLELAEVTVVGALNRKESRGGDAREDYPNRDDTNYMRHTMAYRQGTDLLSDIRLDYKPVVQTRYQPMERKY